MNKAVFRFQGIECVSEVFLSRRLISLEVGIHIRSLVENAGRTAGLLDGIFRRSFRLTLQTVEICMIVFGEIVIKGIRGLAVPLGAEIVDNLYILIRKVFIVEIITLAALR